MFQWNVPMDCLNCLQQFESPSSSSSSPPLGSSSSPSPLCSPLKSFNKSLLMAANLEWLQQLRQILTNSDKLSISSSSWRWQDEPLVFIKFSSLLTPDFSNRNNANCQKTFLRNQETNKISFPNPLLARKCPPTLTWLWQRRIKKKTRKPSNGAIKISRRLRSHTDGEMGIIGRSFWKNTRWPYGVSIIRRVQNSRG